MFVEVKRVKLVRGGASPPPPLIGLSATPTKWSNAQIICRILLTNYLSVFDPFVGLVLEWLGYKV